MSATTATSPPITFSRMLTIWLLRFACFAVAFLVLRQLQIILPGRINSYFYDVMMLAARG